MAPVREVQAVPERPHHGECLLTGVSSKVSVVIPTYNERENIAKLIPRLNGILSSSRYQGYIVVVDDNSPDGTYREVERYSNSSGNVFLVKREERRGLGGACIDGFRFSNKLNPGIVLTIDADFSHDPESIPKILAKIDDGYDVVIGSRYVSGGRIENWPFHRLLISKVANFLAHVFLGIEVCDVTSNFRAYRSRVMEKVDFSRFKSEGFPFVLEFLYWCSSENFRIGEVPVTYAERKMGRSKLSLKETFRYLKMVMKLALFGL